MGGTWGARRRTAKDERKAQERKARLKAVVYFVEDFEGNIKIGRATDIYVRFAMLQNAHARPLTLRGTIPGGKAEERDLHARFRHAHIRGEWFRGVAELHAYVASVVGEPAPLVASGQLELGKVGT